MHLTDILEEHIEAEINTCLPTEYASLKTSLKMKENHMG